jgi:hypothetical protein
MTVPTLGSVARMAVTAFGGWFAVEKMGLGLEGVFGAMAVGMAVYGCLIAGSLLVAPWRSKRRT